MYQALEKYSFVTFSSPNFELFSAEGQVIKTDQMNILIRALTLKKHKGDTKVATSAEGSRKRFD